MKKLLRFEVIQQTEDRATQRGLEQLYYDQFMPVLNRIRPISLRNDKIDDYLKAARDFLSRLGGQ